MRSHKNIFAKNCFIIYNSNLTLKGHFKLLIRIKENNFKEISKLKEISEMMGKDKMLIQGGGGNTSIKLDNILLVKASGKMLKNAIVEDIFLPVDLYKIRSHFKELNFSKKGITINSNIKTNLKPSIETTFHAIMPHKVVLHSHPIDVITYSICDDLRKNLDQILKGFSWDYINYARPGYPLARLINNALSEKKSDVLILANHGLIIGGETVSEAYDLQNKILDKLKIKPRKSQTPNLIELEKLIKRIPNSKLPYHEIIHNLACDSWSFELAKNYAPYPDHAIFCGEKVLVVNQNNLKNQNLKNHDYFILPNIGVIILKKESQILESMLEMQASIFLRTNKQTPVTFLNEMQCKELLEWEAEKYRKKILAN